MTDTRQIPEPLFTELLDAFEKDAAMKAVIIDSISIGQTINPDSEYHKEYAKAHRAYTKVIKKVIDNTAPEYIGKKIPWEIDFENKMIIIKPSEGSTI